MSISKKLEPIWRVFGQEQSLQAPFDIAVIIPTIGRSSLLKAISSVYAQSKSLRIQLLIGVDVPAADFIGIENLLTSSPMNITPCLFYPGYSTSVRHGGIHPARDGGSLRTVLSYLANARYLAYLDDDNWWEADHLDSLMQVIKDRDWAFSLRRFMHPSSLNPVFEDRWESVGPSRGIFKDKFGGFVDPNCLLIDKTLCEPVLRWWSIPLPNDPIGMSADRHIFHWLSQKSSPGETGKVTVNYVMGDQDPNHRARLSLMGEQTYARAAKN